MIMFAISLLFKTIIAIGMITSEVKTFCQLVNCLCSIKAMTKACQRDHINYIVFLLTHY